MDEGAKLIVSLAVALGTLILVIILASVTTISAGHVGVLKRFGAVDDKHLSPGLHFVTPFVCCH